MNLKIKTEKIKKVPIFIARHSFEFILGALLLSLVIGIVIFYQYNILTQKVGTENLRQSCFLEEETYKDISDIWQKHEKIIEDSATKSYRNLFSIN